MVNLYVVTPKSVKGGMLYILKYKGPLERCEGGANMMFFRHTRKGGKELVTRYARDLQRYYICY